MRFETFKSILLSVGICECEFYLRSTNKEGFVGYTIGNDKKKYCVVFDKGEFYFDKDVDILTGKVINDKTLEEVWDDIEISFIDGLNDEEYVDYIDTPNFYLNEFVALNKVTNTLEVESLINKLKKSEYNGNILLYAGSKELSEFSNQDNEYTYYLFDTFNKGIYLLKKENDIVSFVYLMHWYQKNKLKISGLSIGRKFDKFSLKSGINKSERYSLMLKLQRNQSQDIVGGIFAIIDIIIFILILCGIGLKTIYPMFVYYSLITFVVSMFFTFLFSSLHNKEWKKLNDILFPKKDNKIKYTDMFLEIIKEAEDNGFYELHEALTHINKKITKSGGMFEDGTVDLCFNTKEHEFFIMFYNKFVLINIDEESIDLKIKYKYIDFKDYYELESKIYSTLVEYL